MGYRVDGNQWRLTVADDGSGKAEKPTCASGGLGSGIVSALVKQLEGRMETAAGLDGRGFSTTISGPCGN